MCTCVPSQKSRRLSSAGPVSLSFQAELTFALREEERNISRFIIDSGLARFPAALISLFSLLSLWGLVSGSLTGTAVAPPSPLSPP